jgi:hypothetical protein
MTTKPPLQFFRILQGILHKEKANKTMRGQATPNHKRRKTRNQTVTLIQMHTIKPSNNKNK